MLDVRRLQVLLAVHDQRGVAAAARALSFTPSAVSQQLAALERQVDVALVDRSGRTAVLTPAGQRLAGHARGVLAALEVAEADVAADGGSVRGVLRVATITTLGQSLLPTALVRLRTTCPGLDVRVEQLEPEQSLPALARGDLDLALTGQYALTPRRLPVTLERIELGTEPVHVAVPLDHPLPGPDVHLHQLRDARWVAPAAGSSCGVMLDRSCALAGYEPHVVARCDDFTVAAALVAAGHGVALLPATGAPTDRTLPLRLLTATDPPISRDLYAAVRHGARAAPPLAHLIEALFQSATRTGLLNTSSQ